MEGSAGLAEDRGSEARSAADQRMAVGLNSAWTPSRSCDHGRMYDRVDEIRRLLNEWDFIGVFNPETNVDEYDCMIPPLLAKLAGGAGSSEIRRYLDDEIRGHFGMSP